MNIKGKRYSDRTSKYPDLVTLMRKNQIMALAVQETKLAEADIDVLKAENPNMILESNNAVDGCADIAFLINQDLIKTPETEDMAWKHQILIPGRVSRLTIQWEEQELDIINVYSLNGEKEKLEFYKALQKELEELNDLHKPIILGDFNLVEDALDRLPHHYDKETICKVWSRITNCFKLTDGWRLLNPTEKAYTFSQRNSHSRIDRIYVPKEILDHTNGT
jgi:exonuclease III